jgi:hypothetical protein
VISGHSIPSGVVDQVYMAMRQSAFRVADVEKYCEHALRDHQAPASACIQLATRMVRDCRDSGQIVILRKVGQVNIWEWVDA